MPSNFFRLLPFWRAAQLLLLVAASSCARRNYFQADARLDAATPLPATADSVRVVAGRHYNRHSGFYCLFLGRHYRRVWAAPLTAPVLNLTMAAPGGLQAGKPGGGYQSISMTLNDRKGRGYALRALDKEPSKTLPIWLRKTFLLNVVRDATSAANPYAALTVPPLAQAAGVPHTRPHLVYVRPDETGLGETSARFQGKVALLEEKYNGPADRTPDLAGASSFLDGEDMLRKVYDNPAYNIDQPAFLRARLLDVWLGDWDRHEGQWQWAEFQEKNGRIRYQGIPKDRDQVYFRFDDGLIPWLASRHFIAPQFHTFKEKYGNMNGLVFQARFIDQRGLSMMSRADFQRLALDLQRRLPDTLIERAMRRLPPAVYALEGARLAATLKVRRETLPQAAAAFYRTLAREPVVGGSALADRFVVRRYADSTTVAVFSAALLKASHGDSLRFRRTYYGSETREITLEGLDGNDLFDIETATTAPGIQLALYGGKGNDQVALKGRARRFKFYDEESANTASKAFRPYLPKKRHRAYERLNDD
jgi:hypothetical protein